MFQAELSPRFSFRRILFSPEALKSIAIDIQMIIHLEKLLF